jgi:hypothetical protein
MGTEELCADRTGLAGFTADLYECGVGRNKIWRPVAVLQTFADDAAIRIRIQITYPANSEFRLGYSIQILLFGATNFGSVWLQTSFVGCRRMPAKCLQADSRVRRGRHGGANLKAAA